MINKIRVYFEVDDPLTNETLECFGDFERRRISLTGQLVSKENKNLEIYDEIIVTDWGVLYDRETAKNSKGDLYMTGGRCVQPHWFYFVINEKKKSVIFPEDEGHFYPIKK